jgi:hypothetical protein
VALLVIIQKLGQPQLPELSLGTQNQVTYFRCTQRVTYCTYLLAFFVLRREFLVTERRCIVLPGVGVGVLLAADSQSAGSSEYWASLWDP